MRHVHARDAAFLEAFRDRGVARATAVNAVAVLSRADEIGGGRIDAMFSARRIAGRYRGTTHVRGLCQTVVAVAGLLAETAGPCGRTSTPRSRRCAAPAATTWTGAALGRPIRPSGRARRGRDHRDRAGAARPVRPVRLRLSISLAARGAADAGHARQRTRRPQRTASSCARSWPPSSPSVATCSRPARRCWPWTPCCAQVTAGPAAARSPARSTGSSRGRTSSRSCGCWAPCAAARVTLPKRDADDGERLLGDAGASAAARLGLPPDAPSAELTEAAYAALERWQRHTVNPMLGRATSDACRAVVRSCEGVLAGLA